MKLHATLKEAQCFCKSYYDDYNQLRDCTCGLCKSKTIETWKLDLERLLWSYHENGRPDGKTGVIGNPKVIEEFVQKLLDSNFSLVKHGTIEEVKKLFKKQHRGDEHYREKLL